MKRLISFIMMSFLFLNSATATGDPPSMQAVDLGIHLSFRAGASVMLLNGEDHDLHNAPFMENGAFYVPLREVVELCGGIVKYIPDNKSAIVALPQMGACVQPTFSQVWLETSEIECDGGARDVLPAVVNKDAGVLLKNDITFVPLDYFFRIHFASFVTEGEQAILYNQPYRAGIGPFNIEQDFNKLSAEIQSDFHKTGDTDKDENDPTAQRELWTNGTVSLTLLSNSRYYPENSRIIMQIEVSQSGYQTDWGLQVGDTEERYHSLYLSLNDLLVPEIKDGRVSKITFLSHH